MSTLQANKIQTETGKAPEVAQGEFCRARIQFGAYTNTIFDSFNVASLTDVGIGQFKVNFAVAMADSNYATSSQGNYNSSSVDKDTTNAAGNAAAMTRSFPESASTAWIISCLTTANTYTDGNLKPGQLIVHGRMP